MLRSLARLVASTLLLAACSCSASTAPAAEPAPASAPSSSGQSSAGGDTSATDTRTCGAREVPAGFACATTSGGPALVLASDAPADLDPCPVASCPEGARCEATRQHLGEASRQLPRCVPASGAPSGPPSRDPCARYLCPLGYHCTAPADAPYCVPDGSNW